MNAIPGEPLIRMVLLMIAAFLGGALNAAAGGGTFLTLPALMLVGVPPVAANATSNLVLLPGYFASTWGFREELRGGNTGILAWMSLVSLIGGAVGAVLLLLTSNHAFRIVVPWLMLLATLLFASGPRLMDRLHGNKPVSRFPMLTGVFLVSIYGGYFNGGLGIVLLALLGLLGYTDINVMNGIKNLLSAILTAVAVALYAWGGTLVWSRGISMMFAAILGGYAGARLARRLPARGLRYGVVAIGLVTSGVFFLY